MKKTTIRTAFLLAVAVLWSALAVLAWFGPSQAISQEERRPLAQLPSLTAEAVLSGDFMEDFDAYALDQFPGRTLFRRLKALFHFGVLGQSDSSGIFLAGSYAVKQEYPLDRTSLTHAIQRLNVLYETYLTESEGKIHVAIVPDKGYYVEDGNLKLDYEALYAAVEAGLPWAKPIDLTGSLALEDYYRTDIHWRQENLLETAGVIAEALGVTAPRAEDFTQTTLRQDFYGVYYGQAALPMEPEPLVILENELLAGCRVYDYETGQTGSIYNLEKAEAGRDLYEVYLSGSKSLLTIENPAAATDRELLVFRDSFASSLVPLLLADYARVTLVDTRYIQTALLDQFLDFDGQEVLLLYSVPVLNSSQSMK